MLKDYLPSGLQAVNYTDKTADNPTAYIQYLGEYWQNKQLAINIDENNLFVLDITPYNDKYIYLSYESIIAGDYSIIYSNDDNHSEYKTKEELIDWVENGGGNTYTYNHIHDTSAIVGLNNQAYRVTYYTKVADSEINNINSSETGYKTYENRVIMTDETHGTYSGSAEVTVFAENPLEKIEVQDNGDDPLTWFEIEEGSDESRERYYWYQIKVNPKRGQYNQGNQLRLTDYIDKKIDIIPTTILIREINYQGTEIDTAAYPAATRPTAYYNDDSRILVISNLQDSTSYVIRYQVRVRAEYTDDLAASEYTITNTATLEGKTQWASTKTAEHRVEDSAASVSGGLCLTKIDENDATRTLPGAVFELYKLDTGVQVEYDADGKVINWNKETAKSQLKDEPIASQVINEDDPDKDNNPKTYTSNALGVVNLGSELEPNTLYYWIETTAPEGYLLDTAAKHYFVIYYEGEKNNRTTAWELDDIWTEKYGYTIASFSEGTSWVANNSMTRSLSITKAWDGDDNNAYKTRPDSIDINLIQIDSDGNRKVYSSVTLRADADGNWLDYSNYAWTDLPAVDAEGNAYKYTIEEERVPGYFATYSDNQQGLVSGTITLTNTLIPSDTEITVEKLWEGDDSSDRPNYITVQLKQILTDADGNSGNPVDYGNPVRIIRNADNRWLASWTGLPTKDANGGTYSYTAVETDVPAGYTVRYSDNGRGIIRSDSNDPLTITNTALGSLKISKEFERLNYNDLSIDQMKAVVFEVRDSSNSLYTSFSLYDMGSSLEKVIDNVPAGTYTVIEKAGNESIPQGYGLVSIDYSTENGLVNVVKSSQAEEKITNKYSSEKGRIIVNKSFSGVDLLPDGFMITNDFDNTVFTKDNAVEGNDKDVPYKWILENVPIGRTVVFTESGYTVNGYSMTAEANGKIISGSEIKAEIRVEGTEDCVLAFVNTYEEKVTTIRIVKVSSKDMRTPLTGARFVLKELNDSGTGEYKSGGYVCTSEYTGSDGTVSFVDLKAGYYEIAEETVPDNYVLTENGTFYIRITDEGVSLISKPEGTSVTVSEWSEYPGNAKLVLDKTSGTLTVGNDQGDKLPLTGGNGEYAYFIAGSGLMLIASSIFLNRKKSFR